jgi:hypothetical protein
VKIRVVTPGFAADCLETLEEIAVENAEIFREHGGENFAAIPCLNDSARDAGDLAMTLRELGLGVAHAAPQHRGVELACNGRRAHGARPPSPW